MEGLSMSALITTIITAITSFTAGIVDVVKSWTGLIVEDNFLLLLVIVIPLIGIAIGFIRRLLGFRA